MNPINRIAGAFTGLFTGFLTVLLQIPYIYYVIGRDMREAGYSKFTASLTAMTLGTVMLCPMILFIALNAVGTILLGIRKGWNEGITAAAMLPVAFHATSTGLRDHLPPISKGQGIFSKLQNDLNNLGLAGSTFFKFYSNHLKYKDQQQQKADVVNKIRDLPAEGSHELPLLKEEVEKFIEIMEIQKKDPLKYSKEDPNYQKNIFLYNYLDSRCPISLEKLYDLHIATVNVNYPPNPPKEEERTSIPITLEYSSPSGEKQVFTYNYDVFERWMFEQLEKESIAYISAVAPATVNLADKDMKIYRGYYKDLDVNHIRQVIREWQEKEKKQEPEISIPPTAIPVPEPKATIVNAPSPEEQPIGPSVPLSQAREGFLKGLAARHPPSKPTAENANTSLSTPEKKQNKSL